MNHREHYSPGPANLATVHQQDGETWALVVVRQLRHSREKVWQAITDPAQLREWAPFDADGSLGVEGAKVKLTTVGAEPHLSTTTVTRADAPSLLEYMWGGYQMRWQLEPADGGTRLTLWTNINRRYIAMGAAGWHVCLDVLDHWLSDRPLGRIVAQEALQFDGWRRLHAEYAKQFGVEMPSWGNQ